MIGRQVEIVRLALRHRQREFFGQRRERREGFGRAAECRRQDQRKLRAGEQIRRRIDRLLRRHRRHGAERAVFAAARRGRRIRQHFARQGQIDRAARLAHGDVQRAVDDRRDRLAGAQFVIPFGEFAHHAALVERFLAPMDRPVARGMMPGLGDRRAAGGEQDRNIIARGIHQAVDGVAGAHRDMDHDGGRLAGDLVVAVRHGHGDVLMGHGDDAGKFAPAVGIHGERFDHGREIRPGIGEHIIDAALGKPRQIGLRGNVWGFGISHRLASVLLAFPGA